VLFLNPATEREDDGPIGFRSFNLQHRGVVACNPVASRMLLNLEPLVTCRGHEVREFTKFVVCREPRGLAGLVAVLIDLECPDL